MSSIKKKNKGEPIPSASLPEILEICLDLSANARRNYLATLPPGVRREIESLLEHHQTGGFLETPAAGNLVAPPNPQPGHAFQPRSLGKYFLVQRLGKGGMADVFRAKTVGPGGFEKQVAVKSILATHSDNEQFRKLFEHEARLTSELTHPNIAQIFDFVSVEDNYLLVMEFIWGKNVETVMMKAKQRRTPFPLTAAVHIISEVCRGLAYAHAKRDDRTGEPLNIIHRDITPRNIMLSFDGQVKIVDFGIAKAMAHFGHTQTGVVKGTPRYMSPEQATGEVIDHRSDIYSTAVVLFELVSGSRFHDVDGILPLLNVIRRREPPDAKVEALGVPAELKAILVRALSARPEDRYQDAAALHADLKDFLSHSTIITEQNLVHTLQALFADEIETERKLLRDLDEAAGKLISTTIEQSSSPTMALPPQVSRPAKPQRRYSLWICAVVLLIATAALWQWQTTHQFDEPPISIDITLPTTGVRPIPLPGVCPTQITSTPLGAKILIDGAFVGITPAMIDVSCNMAVSLELEAPGFARLTREIAVRDAWSQVHLSLEQPK